MIMGQGEVRIMNEAYEQKAMALKALSDPNRLVILDYLKDGEKCACRILEQLKITQPTLSHHMRILCLVDLVRCRRDGKWIHYSLNHAKFRELKEMLEGFSIGKDNEESGN
jgi:ArsR family transcriptional regulator